MAILSLSTYCRVSLMYLGKDARHFREQGMQDLLDDADEILCLLFPQTMMDLVHPLVSSKATSANVYASCSVRVQRDACGPAIRSHTNDVLLLAC